MISVSIGSSLTSACGMISFAGAGDGISGFTLTCGQFNGETTGLGGMLPVDASRGGMLPVDAG